MDPLSITTGAAALVILCIQATRQLKNIVEKLKKRRQALLDLLTQTERTRLYLQLLENLTHRLASKRERDITLTFNDSECNKLLREIVKLAEEFSQQSTFGELLKDVKWMVYESKLRDFIRRLKKCEENVNNLLLFIITESAIKTEQNVQELSQQNQTIASTELVVAAESLSLDADRSSLQQGDRLQLWFGDTLFESFNRQYGVERHNFYETAYSGDWTTLLAGLDEAYEKYEQPWANCIRLKTREGATQRSGWAPLHQAVYLSAPLELVEELIVHGAWRTMRTEWADRNHFSCVDLTAIEMARELGRSYLYDILAPVIRHNIPARVIETLEAHFHTLIRTDLGESWISEQFLRLPQLVVLTELENPEMRFVVQGRPYSTNNKDYWYYLDNRDLVVRSFGVATDGTSKAYRITQDGIFETEDPVVFVSRR